MIDIYPRPCGGGCDECRTRWPWRTRKRYRLFGIEVWRIETTDQDSTDDGPGEVTTQAHGVGFVRDDLPTWHRPEEDE